MSSMVEWYHQQALDAPSSSARLSEIQAQARSELMAIGFPTRRDEEWKYTSLDSFLAQPFAKAHVTPELSGGQGLVVMPLAVALIEHEALVKQHLNTIMTTEHGLQALNAAMLADGLFIHAPEGIKITEPLVITYKNIPEGHAVYLRHLIIASPNSELAVVEVYDGGEQSSATNTITEIFADSHSKITHYKLQAESRKAYHFGHVFVSQNGKSCVQSHSLSVGGKLVRSDLSIDLQEEHAECLMNGIYAPQAGQHADHHTVVNHLVPHGSSKQDYKGILGGDSRAVFNGKVRVMRDAQKTSAQQSNKNLLLSKNAEIDTKPQLEIDADDVTCSHGATVGQLDEDALFYLATRGIKPEDAAGYLIRAFAQENLSLIPHDAIAKRFSAALSQQTGAL